MQKLIQPPACTDHGLHRILSFYCMAGELLFDEKIHQNVALIWFRLRDVGILYSQAEIQRTIDASPAFLEHSLAEKITV
jgi:hypothetical protein